MVATRSSRETPLVRWQAAADPVRESPPDIIGGAEGANPPRNLSGSRTAWTRSLWKAGRVSTASALTGGESRDPRATPVKLSGRDDRGGGRRGTRAGVPLKGRVRP